MNEHYRHSPSDLGQVTLSLSEGAGLDKSLLLAIAESKCLISFYNSVVGFDFFVCIILLLF